MTKTYYVYILSNKSSTLYIGVTSDLERRLWQHSQAKAGSFTARNKITRLVYFEETTDVSTALRRERELKAWNRPRKLSLINSVNPEWLDLAEGGFEDRQSELQE